MKKDDRSQPLAQGAAHGLVARDGRKPAAKIAAPKSTAKNPIRVIRNEHGKRATVVGNPACWGQGKNRYEALGHLLYDHPDIFDAAIEFD